MHLDVETLERALHGELAAERDDAAFRHLEECAACAAALEDSRRREQRLFGLLEALDHEAPALDWGAVPAVEPSGGRSRLLVAASIAAVLGAGILYALPDSPLRSWIGGTGGEAASPDAPTGAGGPRSVSGVSIRPTAAFEIALAGSQDSGWVRVEPERSRPRTPPTLQVPPDGGNAPRPTRTHACATRTALRRLPASPRALHVLSS